MAEIIQFGRGISPETIEALENMLQAAQAGDLVGVAVVALYSGFRYTVDVVGEARSTPTFTRGAVQVLDDEVSTLIKDVRISPTR